MKAEMQQLKYHLGSSTTTRRKQAKRKPLRPEDRLCALLNSLDLKQRQSMAELLIR